MDNRLRIGKEAEGPDKDRLTLFVKQFVSFKNEKIVEEAVNNEAKAVYIGSKGTPIVNFRKLEDLRNLLKETDIALVCRVEKHEISKCVFYDDIKYILSLDAKPDLDLRVETAREVLYYEFKDKPILTKLSDENYKTDRQL